MAIRSFHHTQAGLGLLLWGACALNAHAQARYTLKEITAPFLVSASSCTSLHASLNDRGDVVKECRFVAYYDTDNTLVFPIPIAIAGFRPAVWRNGGSGTLLNLPLKKTSVGSAVGVDNSGRVIAAVSTAPANAEGQAYHQQVVSWTGSTATTWNSIPDPDNWLITSVLPSGRVAAVTHPMALGQVNTYDPTGGKIQGRIAFFGPTGAQEVPVPPGVNQGATALVSNLFSYAAPIVANDAGQVLAVTSDASPLFATGHSHINPRHWFWDGQAWTEIVTGNDKGTATGKPVHVNAQGMALLFENATTDPNVAGSYRNFQYVWSKTDGLVALPQYQEADRYPNAARNVVGFERVADNGDVVGQAPFTNATAYTIPDNLRAAIWRKGQLIDVNTLVTAPSGYVFWRLMSENAKGQFLLEAAPTGKSGGMRLFLATPK
jgi:hypothetical protein